MHPPRLHIPPLLCSTIDISHQILSSCVPFCSPCFLATGGSGW
uniref:Uncharacterized protein n=1 Tax=Anguilla anguilla TaxID=7936 RepID=A0A0E9RE48_ANGAN